MATFTKEELESAHGIYDGLKEKLSKKAADPSVFRKIQRELARILDKKLPTNNISL